MFAVFGFFVWFLLSVITGSYAVSKGRNGVGYALLAFLISPMIVFVVIAIAGDTEEIRLQNEIRIIQVTRHVLQKTEELIKHSSSK
ncbi:hypothetical protein AB8613_23840 [Vibrio sp. BS-M-Sm-2]|uniref:hypothetical protein n=1 Tax=Vibrio sp. BS-M-Sm-2 TaxID=3241167 RepID=UPI000FE34E89